LGLNTSNIIDGLALKSSNNSFTCDKNADGAYLGVLGLTNAVMFEFDYYHNVSSFNDISPRSISIHDCLTNGVSCSPIENSTTAQAAIVTNPNSYDFQFTLLLDYNKTTSLFTLSSFDAKISKTILAFKNLNSFKIGLSSSWTYEKILKLDSLYYCRLSTNKLTITGTNGIFEVYIDDQLIYNGEFNNFNIVTVSLPTILYGKEITISMLSEYGISNPGFIATINYDDESLENQAIITSTDWSDGIYSAVVSNVNFTSNLPIDIIGSKWIWGFDGERYTSLSYFINLSDIVAYVSQN